MAAYASARHSKAICQRCGWKYDRLELHKEWNGLYVCETCWESKHPLITPPRNMSDPEAIRRAFPDDTDYGDDPAADDTLDDLFSRTANPDYG